MPVLIERMRGLEQDGFGFGGNMHLDRHGVTPSLDAPPRKSPSRQSQSKRG